MCRDPLRRSRRRGVWAWTPILTSRPGEASCTEGAALLLRENADGETYETRIYLYEGALREEYGTADAALDPQDSERIVDANPFPSSRFDRVCW